MKNGYIGKILFVNLSKGSITEETVGERVYRDFIGGIGLGCRILYERMKARIDPLGPDNLLGFTTGLLTGTAVPASARCMVVTKSPLTGTWGDSNAGGYFGPELKAAGYDAVFFAGISPKPVYLFLHNGTAELKDAAHLWGKDIVETEETLREALKDPSVQVASIGPAGESCSLIAAIITDKGRAWGRSGVGAVMGSKRLKAIVVRGTKKVPVANPQQLNTLHKNFIINSRKAPFIDGLMKYGTSSSFSSLIKAGNTPIKNWSSNGEESFPNHSNLDGPQILKYRVKRYGCSRCPIACGAYVKVESGIHAVLEGHRPEYETLAAFGSMCLNDNLESIIEANHICNRYGIDTISAGTTIALAMECYERGILSKQETDGIELDWGNPEAIIALLERIARRDGFGAVLADGVQRAAQRIGNGAEECAIHIHGQEPGFHDPRFRPARGNAFTADSTPGRHTSGTLTCYVEAGGTLGNYPELATPRLELYGDYERKGHLYATVGNYYQLLSASGLCLFAAVGTSITIPEFISAVTGWDFTMAEGLDAGKRIQTLRQVFNIREGFKQTDFRLPDRLSKPTSMGPFANVTVDFDTLKHGYYVAMGWDPETGKPDQNTVVELGLGDVIQDL